MFNMVRDLLPIFMLLMVSLRFSAPFHHTSSLFHTAANTRSVNSMNRLTADAESPCMSTVIKPRKKSSKTKIEAPEETTSIPGIFKESRDIQKEFEEFEEHTENFILLLFNDPYNKRIYVATCLMQILSFSEEMAADVMMQAHTNGFAVVGEWSKEVADDYCKQLVGKGLLAEVVKETDGDSGQSSDE